MSHEELCTVYYLPVIWSEQIYIIIIIIIIIVVAGHGKHGVRNVYKCLFDNLSHKTVTSAKTER
jgi:hypothetical protein